MSSKYVDNTSILQVIACIFLNPNLLSFNDKYTFSEEDFPDEFHKIVFGSIYNLYDLGAKQITIANIVDYLSTRPKSEAVFQQNKGEEWLLKIKEAALPEAFDYYYSRLKKMTLLRAYDNFGIDVSFIYDVDNILDSKKKQIQEDFLDNSSLETIAEKIDNRIEEIKLQYVDNSDVETCQAGDGIMQLIQNLKDTPEVGIPMYGPLINTVTRGARLKKLYLRSAPTGCGKRVADYTPIPTPVGWKTVGDIQVGDYIFGKNGKLTKVLKLYKNPEKIWKITFSDGRSIDCCDEHLWQYSYRTHRGWASRVENTQTIYQRAQQLKNNFKDSDNRGWRFRIPLNEPVDYPERTYKIPPYVMGLAIGDGSFREPAAISLSSANEELPALFAQGLGHNIQFKKNKGTYTYYFYTDSELKHCYSTKDFLSEEPGLLGTYSETKYIPKSYLLGSIEQRYELLAGLLDTDGSISNTGGRVSYVTVSKQLADDVCELCHSLGMITGITIDQHKEYVKSNGMAYVINIQCKKEIKPKLFKLSSKKQRAFEYAANGKRTEHKEHLSIVNIEPTETIVPMTCFTVDAEDALFQVGDFIVTHNTRSMIADACNFACNKIYDETFGWIKNGTCEPTLYITTEQEVEEVQTMMLAFLSNVNEEHIIKGRYEGNEEERVVEAAKILQNSPLYIEELPDFSLKDIENRIKKNIRDNDVRYVTFDYIHTSLKILEEITRRSGGVKLREDNILFMLAIRLKDLCNEYGIFILTSTQLNGDYVNSKTPDQNLLRGAKSIADKIDWGSVLLPVTQEDIDSLSTVLSNSNFDTPNLKLSIYKNRRGRYKSIYLWCKADLGTCRVNPMFCTGYNYDFIEMEDLKIEVEESAF